MSAILQEYISALSGGNFTHTEGHIDYLNNSYLDFILKPRPPVIGEELESNASQSAMSICSQATAGRRSSSTGTTNLDPVCLTPRKSNMPSYINNEKSTNTIECIAPLGFEPEGSSSQGNFNEASQLDARSTIETPLLPVLKWASGLTNLLNDGEGVRIFRQFLARDKSSNVLDFWFACQGLKLVPDRDTFMLTSLVRLIYRKYIRKETLGLKNNTKRKIVERLRSNSIDASIFESAQEDIMQSMQQESYPLFLKSDLYMDYVRCSLEKLQKSTGNSSGSNESSGSDPTAKSVLGLMPTLHENYAHDSKLNISDISYISSNKYSGHISSINVPLTKDRKDEFISYPNKTNYKGREVEDLANSYTPVSSLCLDSKVQSQAIEAHVPNDNIFQVERTHRHAPAKRMKKLPASNSNLNCLNDSYNLRTNKVVCERDLAEKNPTKFAEILIAKLQKIYDEEHFVNKIKSSSFLSDKETRNFLESTPIKTSNVAHLHLKHGQPTVVEVDDDDDDAAAQSILEQHVSRIWNDEEHPMHSSGLVGREHHCSTKTLPNMHTSYHSKIFDAAETLSLGNYQSINSLNSEFCNPSRNSYNDNYNCYGSAFTKNNNFLNNGDYNGKAWPASYGTLNSSRHSNFFKNENWYLPSSNAYANSNTEADLSQLGASMQRSESQLRAGSMVDLGKMKSQQRETSRSDTEAGWSLPSSQVPSSYPRQPVYAAPLPNRQPFANLFDNYLGNHIVPAARFISAPNIPREKTVIGYYFCDEAVPYRTTIVGTNITLGQFKQHISKRGHYRYFFKKASDEFGSGVVNEEIFNDSDVLPLWEGKIFGKIEKII